MRLVYIKPYIYFYSAFIEEPEMDAKVLHVDEVRCEYGSEFDQHPVFHQHQNLEGEEHSTLL